MYTTVELKCLNAFTRCHEEPIDSMITVPSEPPVSYPVMLSPKDNIEGMKIILQPDGTPWVDGNLFLLWRAKQHPKLSDVTLAAEGANLRDFMNVMYEHKKNYLDFSGREFERPTYIFKAHFKLAVALNEMEAEVANNKIRSMVRFYRWKIAHRNFTPAKPAWKESIIYVSRTTAYGATRFREVVTTDLTFPKNKAKSTEYIYDGGKLRPLNKFEQDAMFNVLFLLENTEMLLVFLLALFSGMRIQTALTIRLGDIIDSSSIDIATYPIHAGEGKLVDTKYGKQQSIEVPGWIHHRLYTYVQSERYQNRKNQAVDRPESEQYVFLSRTGKPLYVSRLDKDKYKSHEKGSAVRKFINDTVQPLLKSRGHNYKFSFHDLRASFGMNLVEERKQLLAQGKIGYLELIDYVAKRLHHSNRETTMSYLDYHRLNQLVHEADSDYQKHIMGLLENQ